MTSTITRREFASLGLAALASAGCARAANDNKNEDAPTEPAPTAEPVEEVPQEAAAPYTPSERVDEIFKTLSLEQKVAQMVMPAIRSWNGANVTSLQEAYGLYEALQRHQYGGLILFGQNITGTEQTVRLVHDLQECNAGSVDAQTSTHIPYLIATDQEGGSVVRLTMGTRMTGSMALGATAKTFGQDDAVRTGQVFGEELAALGINVDFGPCLDIIRDLADAGMSTRVFSDDAELVASLGMGFAKGLAEHGVVATFKHFPGAGDGSDYPTASTTSLEDLKVQGLEAYRRAVQDGADMVMSAAVTFPAFDDQHVMGDGAAMGYYPASMSPKIMDEFLRKELAYEGVVVTDALEMEQFVWEPDTGAVLLQGTPYTASYAVNVAQEVINAGCDLLLIPTDLKDEDSVYFFDSYISGIAQRVEDGSISQDRIDESVRRILTLKDKYGVLGLADDMGNVEDAVATALTTVGSMDHHEVERQVAEHAVTLLKDDGVLPLPADGANVAILGRLAMDEASVEYALSQLRDAGTLGSTQVAVDYYYDYSSGIHRYGAELASLVSWADYVVCLSSVGDGAAGIQDSSSCLQALNLIQSDAAQSGARFILLSDGIPVDVTRMPSSDAIVCAYLSAGVDIDPTTRSDGSATVKAFNANIPAAIRAIFGDFELVGHLPIDIPRVAVNDYDTWTYTDEPLYERGSGITS